MRGGTDRGKLFVVLCIPESENHITWAQVAGCLVDMAVAWRLVSGTTTARP